MTSICEARYWDAYLLIPEKEGGKTSEHKEDRSACCLRDPLEGCEQKIRTPLTSQRLNFL